MLFLRAQLAREWDCSASGVGTSVAKRRASGGWGRCQWRSGLRMCGRGGRIRGRCVAALPLGTVEPPGFWLTARVLCVSSQESIYSLLPEKQVVVQKPPMYRSIHSGTCPPTGSTFCTKSNVYNCGIYNLGGATDGALPCLCFPARIFLLRDLTSPPTCCGCVQWNRPSASRTSRTS